MHVAVRPNLELEFVVRGGTVRHALRGGHVQHRVPAVVVADVGVAAGAVTAVLVHRDVDVIDLVRHAQAFSRCVVYRHYYNSKQFYKINVQ